MKKTIIVGIICLLVAGIPISSAVSIEKPTIIKNLIEEQSIQTLEDIPDWAIGNFTGI